MVAGLLRGVRQLSPVAVRQRRRRLRRDHRAASAERGTRGTVKTNRDDYRRLIERFRDAIRSCVPGGTVIAVVSRGDDDLVRMDGYRAWHYPRGEWGEYAGHHPATSAEALLHLRRLYRQGARYLAFPATSTWWLEHYRELSEHLEANHAALLKQD